MIDTQWPRRGRRTAVQYRDGGSESRARVIGLMLAMTAAIALAACTDSPPLEPEQAQPLSAQMAVTPPAAEVNRVIATLRRATDRYHDLDVAIADGFVHLHDCEVRPGEGPVGLVYVHPGRLSDAIIDPALPEGLIYEPGRNGRPKLVGAELVIPFSLWPSPVAPRFLGATFQPEEEFGVYGLHVWIWRQNPNGLFEETNPNVTCGQ